MPARPGKEYNIMATCKKCGADMDENAKQCPVCGAPVEQDQGNSSSKQSAAEAAFTEFNNTADTTAEFDSKDIADNKVMAVLAYIGIIQVDKFRYSQATVQKDANNAVITLLVFAIYG